MMSIRRITSTDAALLREVRLRALSDTPMAFGSTHAREIAFAPEEWQSRADRLSHSPDGGTFFAFDADQCCGIIGGFRRENDASTATVVSMWVAPESRRCGIGEKLIDAVAHWVQQNDMFSLLLDVVENNAPAIAFYQKCGFAFTGETDWYPNAPNVRELFMRKRLTEEVAPARPKMK
jgi:ribosomal protein S18 acetylase RimI-like enzyme